MLNVVLVISIIVLISIVYNGINFHKKSKKYSSLENTITNIEKDMWVDVHAFVAGHLKNGQPGGLNFRVEDQWGLDYVGFFDIGFDGTLDYVKYKMGRKMYEVNPAKNTRKSSPEWTEWKRRYEVAKQKATLGEIEEKST